MSKHYIRLDQENRIIKTFSTDFEQPLEGDICTNENGGRHFELNGEVNLNLVNIQGISLYKYENGQVFKRTQEEIRADENLIPQQKSEEEKLKIRVDALEDVLMELI